MLPVELRHLYDLEELHELIHVALTTQDLVKIECTNGLDHAWG